MADLDDFFAKKDKKKSKSKKFATTEELAKRLEDTTKKSEEKLQKEPTVIQLDGGDYNNADQEQDDEWKEFEEENPKDYTGLKIGQLQLNDDDEYGENGDGTGSDGEGNTDKHEKAAWTSVASTSSAQKTVVLQEEDNKVPKLYISPALRQQQIAQQRMSDRLRKGVAPDLANEDYFPTLGAAKPEEQRKKKNEPAFEEVKHGGRVVRSADIQTNAPVSIGNRFNSLADS